MVTAVHPVDYDSILAFDLELTREDKFRQLGAVLAAATLDLRANPQAAIRQLDDMAEQAELILGHNILHHDLPWLALQPAQPQKLLDKPIIDTLYLSPLAFPANPYHRLIKDYKLVRDSINDPVNDARLSLKIFAEQVEALKKQPAAQLQLYQYLFEHGVCENFNTRGLARVFASLTGMDCVPPPALPTLIKSVAWGRVCPNQLTRVIGDALRQPLHLLPLAFACAWLPVSGGNSVLPPWIWHRFPVTADIIRKLREEKCEVADCPYCRENHDARRHLRRVFELDNFRNLPNGVPLQRNIVECGLANRSLLGILPTSGGKSLCYQLPAIVRNIRNGSLTIVISPLQALMKDQVDNLQQKAGIKGVAAISGMLTLPERGAILEQVRQGDIAILYLSPEQLRNRAVKRAIGQRQIGGWVFDEAHCLSKWGHDFRPDYLYCAHVIETLAREQQVSIPPVFCYTATAKLDVINDICQHFSHRLPQPLARFEGGVERTNLHYEILQSSGLSKLSQILALLEQFFGDNQQGSCIIYCATRRAVDEIADALARQQSLPVARFYARLESGEKKDILEGFIAGVYRIVCATNAFGMGIDKDDVRLVIHAEIPGSLENYLQEAGRAGRDTRDAHCVLLFNEQDIEKQFRLQAISEVTFKDIRAIFRGIKKKANDNNELVATSIELINQPMIETSFSLDDSHADTKVKTGVAWLERVGYVSRHDNITQVFQGKATFTSLEEAQRKLAALNLNPTASVLWNAVLQALLNADEDEGLSADSIADDAAQYLANHSGNMPHIEAKDVMRVLTQLADIGLVSQGLLLTARMRPKGKDNARQMVESIHDIEIAMLDLMRESQPDITAGEAYAVHIIHFNQQMIERGYPRSNTTLLQNLLFSWSQDAKTNGRKGLIDFRYGTRNSYQITVNRGWSEINEHILLRHRITLSVLNFLYQQAADSEESSVKKVMLSFSLEQVIDHLRHDIDIIPLLQQRQGDNEQKWLMARAERVLLYLHEQHAIVLQNGLAVFRSAMFLKLQVENSQRYVKADYQPLARHYQQKTLQIHVMNEYARLGLEQPKLARQLVNDYFSLDTESFVPLYFKGRRKVLELATSESSWKRIVEDLHNQEQEQIVQASPEQNMLVLAGPGSGKSKVIIHRCAWLMRVKQIDPRKILILCFNRNAAISLRRRLKALLGRDGAKIMVQTFHGLALSLTGHMVGQQDKNNIDFDKLLLNAVALLKGEEVQLGQEVEEQREALLGGLEYLLVDEYQDIANPQYQLIAALAGKNESEEEARLNLMAVGDDDQSIYGFRAANVHFIRLFAKDYEAHTHFLTWNYRSTANIIACSNHLISHNQDRMKRDHPGTIDVARQMLPAGGVWSELDALRGKVIIQHCCGVAQQAAEVVRQIRYIQRKQPECPLEQIAILARNGIDKNELAWVRSALADAGVPCRFSLEKENSFQLRYCLEMVNYLTWLREQELTPMTPAELRQVLPAPQQANRWHNVVYDLIEQWALFQGNDPLPAAYFEHFMQEYLHTQSRQLRFGDGILLSTVHGVKGEEFEHVIILDGGWQNAQEQKPEIDEEERRLFYVAMTRAISRLVILHDDLLQHPYTDQLAKDTVIHSARRAATPETLRRFSILGLSQFFISFAAGYATHHPVHRALDNMKVGDSVKLVVVGNNIQVMSGKQVIAQLSKQAKNQWQPMLARIKQAEVLAMVQYHRQEGERDKSLPPLKAECWKIPVLLVETCGER